MAGAAAALRPPSNSPCLFCQIARSSTSTPLLYSDDRVAAFPDINPSAFRHYLVVPIEHISTVKDLKKNDEDYHLVNHLLNVGQTLLHKDAPGSNLYRYLGRDGDDISNCRFGFHQPPFNSVNHLHLHCFALPFIPRWRKLKYLSLGPLGGFIEAEKLLEKIKPLTTVTS